MGAFNVHGDKEGAGSWIQPSGVLLYASGNYYLKCCLKSGPGKDSSRMRPSPMHLESALDCGPGKAQFFSALAKVLALNRGNLGVTVVPGMICVTLTGPVPLSMPERPTFLQKILD